VAGLGGRKASNAPGFLGAVETKGVAMIHECTDWNFIEWIMKGGLLSGLVIGFVVGMGFVGWLRRKV
jgi:hypothetical protein